MGLKDRCKVSKNEVRSQGNALPGLLLKPGNCQEWEGLNYHSIPQPRLQTGKLSPKFGRGIQGAQSGLRYEWT